MASRDSGARAEPSGVRGSEHAQQRSPLATSVLIITNIQQSHLRRPFPRCQGPSKVPGGGADRGMDRQAKHAPSFLVRDEGVTARTTWNGCRVPTCTIWSISCRWQRRIRYQEETGICGALIGSCSLRW